MPLILGGDGTIKTGASTPGIAINTLGYTTHGSQPSFFAYNSSAPSTNWANGSVIVYNATDHNVGGGYNTSNGRFTVPISGRYFFAWSQIGTNSNSCYRYYLFKNGTYAVGQSSAIQARLDGSGSKYPYATRAAILNLTVGDYMQIYYTSDDGAAAGNWDYYTFYGYLVA
jgi:hypothetical protein